MTARLIDLRRDLPPSRFPPAVQRCQPLLEQLLGITALNDAYARFQMTPSEETFFRRCLSTLRVRYRTIGLPPAVALQQGPLLVVGNHPMGGLEGVIAGDLLTRLRPDVKLLANYLLNQIPEITPWLIEVDPFQSGSDPRRNLTGLKAARRHLKGGGCLITFPAGSVAHWQWDQRRIVDPPWHANIARLALATATPVLPLYFSGRNSWLFQLSAVVSRRARLLLLAREFMARQGECIEVIFGEVIPSERIAQFATPDRLTHYLRRRTYRLAHRDNCAEQPLSCTSRPPHV